jgi:hypothetical protein
MAKFDVNGKSYASLDEMPPDVRQAYEQMVGVFTDKNRDGVPDIMEGGMGAGSADAGILPMQINSTRFSRSKCGRLIKYWAGSKKSPGVSSDQHRS